MASPATSDASAPSAWPTPPRIQFRTVDGTAAPAPREWEPMWLEVVAPPANWESATVRVGGRPVPVSLRRLGDAVRMVAEWPRSGPGTYRIEVEASGERSAHTATVRPAKISPAEFEALLTALETELPASVALALQKAGGLAGVRLVRARASTLAEEVARVRRAVVGDPDTPGLLRLLAALMRAPNVALRGTERWTRRELARQPAPGRLVHAYARHANVAESGMPREVVDVRVRESTDTYENRLVATFVTQVDRRLRRLESLTNALGVAFTGEVQELRERLGRARRASSFLDGVTELRAPPTHVSMVLLRRPAYRATLIAFLAFQRGLAARLEDPALAAPLGELPALYQMWGTLQVIVALLEAAAPLGYRVHAERLIGRDAGGLFVRVLPPGHAAVVLDHPKNGRCVRLIPERTYPAGPAPVGAPPGTLRSATFAQRPDIAVEVTESGGGTRVYLFDPKYKLADVASGIAVGAAAGSAQPTKTDLDKMHAYRDAIRDGPGRRVVEHASILYPGSTIEFSSDIAALGALPSDGDGLRAQLRRVLGAALA